MTPGVAVAKRAKVNYTLHEYKHDPRHESYGLEAAEKLLVDPARVFKTLVVEVVTGELVVAILPVMSTLNLKKIASVAGAKKASMADKVKVQKVTGYVLGGVSPLGQKKSLKTAIDKQAEQFPTILVSGGKRGLEIELAPSDLARLTRGDFADLVVTED